MIQQGWEFDPPFGLWEFLNLAGQQDFWRKLNSGSIEDIEKLGDILTSQQTFFRSHAGEIHGSKNQAAYPKAKFSDRKRVRFFAKVFAGLEFGISPAYAIKLLSRISLPKEGWRHRWARASLQSSPIGESSEIVQTLRVKAKKKKRGSP